MAPSRDFAQSPGINDDSRHHIRGSRQLRGGRCSLPNHVYHVTTSTHDREPFFTNYHLGREVLLALKREDEAGHAETLAFVVMPDHLHWLMRLTGTRDLSVVVNTVTSFSARRINFLLRRRGPVWQKGFHDHAIRVEEDLIAAARYIVANPLRAGLVDDIGAYSLWDAEWI